MVFENRNKNTKGSYFFENINPETKYYQYMTMINTMYKYAAPIYVNSMNNAIF